MARMGMDVLEHFSVALLPTIPVVGWTVGCYRGGGTCHAGGASLFDADAVVACGRVRYVTTPADVLTLSDLTAFPWRTEGEETLRFHALTPYLPTAGLICVGRAGGWTYARKLRRPRRGTGRAWTGARWVPSTIFSILLFRSRQCSPAHTTPGWSSLAGVTFFMPPGTVSYLPSVW